MVVRSADDSQMVSNGGEGRRTDNKEEKRDCKSHSHPHLSSPLLSCRKMPPASAATARTSHLPAQGRMVAQRGIGGYLKKLDSIDCNLCLKLASEPLYKLLLFKLYPNAMLTEGVSLSLVPWINLPHNSGIVQYQHQQRPPMPDDHPGQPQVRPPKPHRLPPPPSQVPCTCDVYKIPS